MSCTSRFLNRFTEIQYLKKLLKQKKLTLLNPELSWKDCNDKEAMELYRENKNKKSIYALCLTDERETIHHWNTFAGGKNGCCIEFNYDKLINAIQREGVISRSVEYYKIKDLRDLESIIEQLPFLKRCPFRPEKEFRIVALCDEPQKKTFDIPIPLDSIQKITITQQLPESDYKNVEECIKSIYPEFKGIINHSTLLKNSKWIKTLHQKTNEETYQ